MFTAWKTDGSCFIQKETFDKIVGGWGLINNSDYLFEWLDQDHDGKISFQDLKETVGVEITPMEAIFFRQDVKNTKTVPCAYNNCWENI